MITTTYKIKAVFSKTGDMRFISHLDLIRVFQRALRRTELPFSVTKGFSPHIKISIARALKLGVESAGEQAVFSMDVRVDPKQFTASMNACLPDGIRIVSSEESV